MPNYKNQMQNKFQLPNLILDFGFQTLNFELWILTFNISCLIAASLR